MSIAFSRTGVSTLRMQAAAQALLAAGWADTHAADLDTASSVSRLHRDRNQIIHALRFITDMKQEVTLMAPDLRRSIRTRLLAVDQRAGEVILRLAETTVADWTTAGRIILTGRFLERPLVCALEPDGMADLAESPLFRIVMPAWMLLADQREAYRVKPPSCRLVLPWGEVARVIDISEGGLALALSAPPPMPVQAGAGWSGLLMHNDAEAAIPLYLTVIHALPQGNAGLRIGTRLRAVGSGARLRLGHLIGRHVDLFVNPQPAA